MDPRENDGSMERPSTTARSTRKARATSARIVARAIAPPPEGRRMAPRPEAMSE